MGFTRTLGTSTRIWNDDNLVAFFEEVLRERDRLDEQEREEKRSRRRREEEQE